MMLAVQDAATDRFVAFRLVLAQLTGERGVQVGQRAIVGRILEVR